MPDQESTPQQHRHHRRRANGAARGAFTEARRAGLVQRHLRKLHHLSRRGTADPPPVRRPDGVPFDRTPPAPAPAPVPSAPPSTSEAA
ncbi:hypothetical protein [Amycolatopsis rifamycinica]|uniref:Uncharacterized protein n=1 Tax=Amycolatopsis rifamycinica TaxID=287986 RepID=A0A066UF51_9PSEU|nr:hypothetical protein [Amycolatopsis rifamycinica]KDN22774.1 hypothetical protein DV20_06985 [Amycolatopsis rifamycinica]